MKQLSDYIHCREYDKSVSKATASENGLTFELINSSNHTIEKWKIDGCVLGEGDGKKCDFLFVVKEPSACYWIELKDEDLDEACLQIYATINNLSEAKNYNNHYARVVLGRFTEDRNRIDNLRYTNLKKLINCIGGINKLDYKTKILQETI